MNKIIKIIKQPKLIILYLMNLGYLKWINDKTYLKIKYKLTMKKKLNLIDPKTFNEKLQWLKMYDRKKIYTTMVDKYEAKKYVSSIIGKEYIIPTIGIYNKFDEIDFNKLPNQFVIKPTHTSGNIFICKDKSQINYKKLNKDINKWLKREYYYYHREWPYKNVKPRIIVEKYMEDSNNKELIDYKVYAFNGKCDYIMACLDRQSGNTKFFYYDREWKLKKEFSTDGMNYGDTIKLQKPKNLETIFNLASTLSKGIPFVRVDFYEINGHIYFGEMTFYPSAGFDTTRPEILSKYLNDMLNLEEIKK